MSEQVSASVTISCPPDQIYEMVSDLPRMREWSPESTGGRWLTADGPRRGARFVGRNRTGRRRWTTLTTVTKADRPHRFAFRVSAPLAPIATWEYVIEPHAGGCRVTETWVDQRPAAIKLISTLRTGVADRGPFTERSMQRTLSKLKNAAEPTPSVT